MGKGKPRKRYGPLRNRGICRRVQEQSQEATAKRNQRDEEERRAAEEERQRLLAIAKNGDEKRRWYVITKGTCCMVRRPKGEWRQHQTQREIKVQGYLEQGVRHWVFLVEGWEIRVGVGFIGKAF